MFSGVIKNRIVYCCHPVVVVGKSGVAASFSNVDEALQFLVERGLGYGTIYRHTGSDWDKVPVDPLQVLESMSHRQN